jgi:hypothetical protein
MLKCVSILVITEYVFITYIYIYYTYYLVMMALS